jgi:hypothetical protein
MECIEEEDTRTVYIDKEDICVWCEQQYGCPLIECLANGLVEASEPIRVVDCAHYIMFDGK